MYRAKVLYQGFEIAGVTEVLALLFLPGVCPGENRTVGGNDPRRPQSRPEWDLGVSRAQIRGRSRPPFDPVGRPISLTSSFKKPDPEWFPNFDFRQLERQADDFAFECLAVRLSAAQHAFHHALALQKEAASHPKQLCFERSGESE